MSSSSAYKKKLIEVALPLDDINAAAYHEKMPGIGAHPRGLHLWWARRPFTTARAVIWASLVDDPSAHPEEFPTEEEQQAERERLFGILRELVIWEKSNNPLVLDAAKAEIHRSMGDDVPALLDPFAGGGAIPLEAQRLGLKAYAQDLNPVAVTINKAMIEIPPKFAGHKPVNPRSRVERPLDMWEGNTGLAADVEYYGNWMREEAFRRIGHLYPKVRVPKEQGSGEATVIAWIWARTVKCPNPACGHETPLVRSFDLSKKKGKEWHVEPIVENGEVRFEVKPGKSDREGTVNRRGATCLHCGMPIGFPHVRSEGRAHRMGERLMAIVAEGARGRIYVNPDDAQICAAMVEKPKDYPDAKIAANPRDFKTPNYGLDHLADLFTNRQLTALTTFSALVKEAQQKAYEDACASGMADDGIGLDDGGTGALAYGQAVGVYLAFAVDRLPDFSNSVTRWSATNEKPMNLFSKQAIPMTWDYPEANPFSDSAGGFRGMLRYLHSCILELPAEKRFGIARQWDAQSDNGMRGILVSADPPYYDNIGYADLSDFFYVWLRQSLKDTYPKLFSTMLVPKAEELVATPYRFEGNKRRAKEFFEEGMLRTFQQVYQYAREDVPVTIYYAFKQSETVRTGEGDKTASSGWETILAAMIKAGFSITGTWPVRTEQAYRSISMGSNALASSIVLVCRKRPDDAPICTRRELVTALRRELHPALDKLQATNIAPVDLAQSAIGPGIGVYSRYAHVLDADGSEMGVRAALQLINEELDAYFNDQSDGTDAMSRFCIELYTQAGFNDVKYGEAEVLANAKNVSIQAMEDKGLLNADKGIVHLLTRDQIEMKTSLTQPAWLLAQQLTVLLDKEGIEGCAKHISRVSLADAERAKSLAYRLFTIADRRGWAGEAFAYNSLVTSWSDVINKAVELKKSVPVQEELSF